MATKNLALKIAIVESGLSQVDLAEAIDMHDTKLSFIVNGRRKPTDVEQKAILRVVNRRLVAKGYRERKPAELFPPEAIAS
jgi:ribosome-binding protein aMBF1 (putative translation factor)